jgi:hypothetical protein
MGGYIYAWIEYAVTNRLGCFWNDETKMSQMHYPADVEFTFPRKAAEVPRLRCHSERAQRQSYYIVLFCNLARFHRMAAWTRGLFYSISYSGPWLGIVKTI